MSSRLKATGALLGFDPLCQHAFAKPDAVADAEVGQLAALHEVVHRPRRHAEERRGALDGEPAETARIG
jgi:hypothetical protein